MRERYWDMYYKIKYQFFYYKYFLILFNRINWGITVFFSLTSLSCIAAWSIWDSYPILWSCLICISQLLQALFPKLPYNDQLISVKFMLEPLNKLLLDIDHTWLKINFFDCSDKKIEKYIIKYEALHSDLVSKFFSSEYLPAIKYCSEKATEECVTHFSMYTKS